MTDRVKLTELAQKTSLNPAGTGSSTGSQATSNQKVELLFANDATFVAGGDNTDLSSLLAGLNNGSNEASSNFFANYESQLNGMMNSAMRQAKTQMTISTIGQVAGTLGTILGGSSATGGLFNLGGLFGSGNAGAAAGAAAGAGAGAAAGAGNAGSQTGVALSSDLASAISNYSSKGSNENWTALNNQIALAKNDKATLEGVVSKNDAVVRKFNEEKPQLEQAVKDAQAEVNKAQKAVDDNRIGVQAEIRVNTIVSKDIPEQEGIITKSEQKVTDAGTKYDSVVKEQDAIIAKNKPDLQAMKTVTRTITNADGTTTTMKEEVPDEAKRAAADKAIKAAEEAKKKAKEEYEKVLQEEIGSKTPGSTPTENSVQGKAKAKIEALNQEKAQQEQVVAQNGGKAQVEEIISARQAAGKKLEDAESNLQKAKDEKDAAVKASSQASSQIKTLDKQIEQAEKLMSKKK